MRVRDIISEAPLPPEWDKSVFTPNVAYKKRIDYAVERAHRLGRGSSRTAVEIMYEGRATVLKVAHNIKGMAQNAAEAELLSDGYLGRLDIVIPIIDYDMEHNEPVWIHTEKAEVATDYALCTMMCCIDLDLLLSKASDMSHNTGFSKESKDAIINRYGEEGWETFVEYAGELASLAKQGVDLGDFISNENWGIYQGRPVVIDLGYTNDVRDTHYSF